MENLHQENTWKLLQENSDIDDYCIADCMVSCSMRKIIITIMKTAMIMIIASIPTNYLNHNTTLLTFQLTTCIPRP